MRRLRLTLAVARFEFLRVFKPKDAVVTLVLFCCGGLFFAWLGQEREISKAPVTVVGDAFELEDAPHLPFKFLRARSASEDQFRKMNASGEIGPLVVIRGRNDVEIVLRDARPAWLPQLQAVIHQAQRLARLKDRPTSVTKARVEVLQPEAADEKDRQQRIAYICVGIMVLGVFIGNAHLFTGITGEKQNRVTESVVSAITPQTWIDGKLIGLSAVAIYGLVVIAVGWLVANELYGCFLPKVEVPFEIIDSSLLLGFLSFTILGFILWFAFFGAVASTIDDPNTSSRSVFMFLPAVGIAMTVSGIDAPDAGMFRAASIFPLTSPAAMPVRMVVGNPVAWELAVAVVLLVLTIHLFRRTAGKVFAMGMLTYGTEPTWREMARAFWRS